MSKACPYQLQFPAKFQAMDMKENCLFQILEVFPSRQTDPLTPTNNTMKRLIYILTAFLSINLASAQTQVKKGSVLIKNTTVLTITDGVQEETDVLVENGIIKRIGKGLSAPSNTPTVDASGKYLMPGIIDAHSHLALSVVN